MRRARVLSGLSVAYAAQSLALAPPWQSVHVSPSDAEKKPMVFMNSRTGMPLRTWMSLNACSESWTRGAVACGPVCATTPVTRRAVNAATAPRKRTFFMRGEYTRNRVERGLKYAQIDRSPNPIETTINTLAAAFEARTGTHVAVTYGTGVSTRKTVASGGGLDVSLLSHHSRRHSSSGLGEHPRGALVGGIVGLIAAVGLVILSPAVWVAMEVLRAYVFIGGFPWIPLGNTMVTLLPIAQLVSLVGVFGLSWFVAMLNVGFAVSAMATGARCSRANPSSATTGIPSGA